MNSYAGNLQSPPVFNMPNMGASANQAFNAIGGIENTFGGLGANVLPGAQATASNLYNNPYAGMAQGGANTAAPIGMAGAGATFDAGMSLIPGATSIMNTGFDPQYQLYQRTLQQVQDQARAAQGARGIATTPYGAGLENDATRNFNIDWQNAQLQRQAMAAGAAGPLATTGAGLANDAAPLWLKSAMLPYSTYSGIGSGQFDALSKLLGIGGEGANLANTPVTDWLNYSQVGNQAGGVANQNFANQLRQSDLGWQQFMGIGKGLGSLAAAPFTGGMSLGWGPWAMPGGGGGYSSSVG